VILYDKFLERITSQNQESILFSYPLLSSFQRINFLDSAAFGTALLILSENQELEVVPIMT
jgi:hypothetical protein